MIDDHNDVKRSKTMWDTNRSDLKDAKLYV